MRLILGCLVTFLVLSGCNSLEDKDSKIYVGAYRSMDELVPYPYILQQKKDSTVLFDTKGQQLGKIKNSSLKKDVVLKFGLRHWKVLGDKEDRIVFWDLSDTTNFFTYKNGDPIYKFAALFKKIEPKPPIDTQKLKSEITNSIWKYKVVSDENTNPNEDLDIERVLHFKNGSLTVLTNYYYEELKLVSEFEYKAFEIFQIEDASFLSFQKEADNPQSIYQITKYDSDLLELTDFSSPVVKTIILEKASLSFEQFETLTETSVLYANCFDGYQGEYYYKDVTYNKGNNFIIEQVNEGVPNIDVASGYIIVHFTINCSGNVGHFGLIQMDRAYKKMYFSKDMVHHVLAKVSELNDFPSTNSESHEVGYKDVHAFLMFKVENGKIIDLCP